MTNDDLLERSNLTDELTRAIVGSDRSKSGARVVALVGPWGSGKSWVLDEVRPRLNGVTRVFNPWLYSDEIGLFRGFAALVVERIKDKKARRNIVGILEVIGPSVKAFGVDASGSISAIAKKMKGDGSPASVRAQITKAIGGNAAPIYVVLDDLDRLTPDELLLVLKLLRLVGDLPGFTYVLAYDEATLLRLITRTQIAHDSMDFARSYLDKVVERTVAIPPLSDNVRTRLVLDPIVEFGQSFHQDFDEKEIEHLRWKMESLVFPRLDTIRLCERYVDSVKSLPHGLQGEIRYRDWVLLSFLRTVEPHAFQTIQKYPSIMLGRAPGFGVDKKRSADYANRVADEMVGESSSELQKDQVLEIVDELFPRFSDLRSGTSYYSDESGQGIDSSMYFSLYFEHGLPSGAISDVATETALAALESSADGVAVEAALTQLIERGEQLAVSAIRRRWKRAVSAPRLLEYLGSHWTTDLFHYVVDGLFRSYGTTQARFLAQDLLEAHSQVELELLTIKLPGLLQVDSLLTEVLVSTRSPAGSKYYVDWIDESRQLLVDEFLAKLRREGDNAQRALIAEVLAKTDKRALRHAAKEMVESGSVRPAEAASWFLRFSRSPSAGFLHVGIEPHVLADAELVATLRSGDTENYRPEWDQKEKLRAELNMETPPEAELIARYILSDWGARSSLSSEDVDDDDD